MSLPTSFFVDRDERTTSSIRTAWAPSSSSMSPSASASSSTSTSMSTNMAMDVDSVCASPTNSQHSPYSPPRASPSSHSHRTSPMRGSVRKRAAEPDDDERSDAGDGDDAMRGGGGGHGQAGSTAASKRRASPPTTTTTTTVATSSLGFGLHHAHHAHLHRRSPSTSTNASAASAASSSAVGANNHTSGGTRSQPVSLSHGPRNPTPSTSVNAMHAANSTGGVMYTSPSPSSSATRSTRRPTPPSAPAFQHAYSHARTHSQSTTATTASRGTSPVSSLASPPQPERMASTSSTSTPPGAASETIPAAAAAVHAMMNPITGALNELGGFGSGPAMYPHFSYAQRTGGGGGSSGVVPQRARGLAVSPMNDWGMLTELGPLAHSELTSVSVRGFERDQHDHGASTARTSGTSASASSAPTPHGSDGVSGVGDTRPGESRWMASESGRMTSRSNAAAVSATSASRSTLATADERDAGVSHTSASVVSHQQSQHNHHRPLRMPAITALASSSSPSLSVVVPAPPAEASLSSTSTRSSPVRTRTPGAGAGASAYGYHAPGLSLARTLSQTEYAAFGVRASPASQTDTPTRPTPLFSFGSHSFHPAQSLQLPRPRSMGPGPVPTSSAAVRTPPRFPYTYASVPRDESIDNGDVPSPPPAATATASSSLASDSLSTDSVAVTATVPSTRRRAPAAATSAPAPTATASASADTPAEQQQRLAAFDAFGEDLVEQNNRLRDAYGLLRLPLEEPDALNDADDDTTLRLIAVRENGLARIERSRELAVGLSGHTDAAAATAEITAIHEEVTARITGITEEGRARLTSMAAARQRVRRDDAIERIDEIGYDATVRLASAAQVATAQIANAQVAIAGQDTGGQQRYPRPPRGRPAVPLTPDMSYEQVRHMYQMGMLSPRPPPGTVSPTTHMDPAVPPSTSPPAVRPQFDFESLDSPDRRIPRGDYPSWHPASGLDYHGGGAAALSDTDRVRHLRSIRHRLRAFDTRFENDATAGSSASSSSTSNFSPFGTDIPPREQLNRELPYAPSFGRSRPREPTRSVIETGGASMWARDALPVDTVDNFDPSADPLGEQRQDIDLDSTIRRRAAELEGVASRLEELSQRVDAVRRAGLTGHHRGSPPTTSPVQPLPPLPSRADPWEDGDEAMWWNRRRLSQLGGAEIAEADTGRVPLGAVHPRFHPVRAAERGTPSSASDMPSRAHAPAHARGLGGPDPMTATTPEERAARWRRVSSAFEEALMEFEREGVNPPAEWDADEGLSDALRREARETSNVAQAAYAAAGPGAGYSRIDALRGPSSAALTPEATMNALMEDAARITGLVHQADGARSSSTASAAADRAAADRATADRAAAADSRRIAMDTYRRTHERHEQMLLQQQMMEGAGIGTPDSIARQAHIERLVQQPWFLEVQQRQAASPAAAASHGGLPMGAPRWYLAGSSERRMPTPMCNVQITAEMGAEDRAKIVHHIARAVLRMAATQRRTLAGSTLTRVAWAEVDEEGMERDECCAVCQDEYVTEDKVSITACKHMYHASCLDTWFATPSASTCPMCRRDLAALACIAKVTVAGKDVARTLWMESPADLPASRRVPQF